VQPLRGYRCRSARGEGSWHMMRGNHPAAVDRRQGSCRGGRA
jgi:hypothetical protein